jgi:hypothetical protein
LSRELAPKIATKTQEAIVEGISMWPVLLPGYRVVYRPVDMDALKPGDLIVLSARGRKGEKQLRVHRLLGRIGPMFLEAGDNAFSASLVEEKQILGRVEQVRDWKAKQVSLPAYAPEQLALRFRFFLFLANSFLFAHEMKDRLFGSRKSFLLWKASEFYRGGLAALGVSVPAIPPK